MHNQASEGGEQAVDVEAKSVCTGQAMRCLCTDGVVVGGGVWRDGT